MLTFDNVWGIPSYSDIESRHSEVSLSVGEFQIPVIASCMDTVINSEVAGVMRELGGTGVMHRYDSVYDQTKKYQETWGKDKVFCAIGASGDYKERFWSLYESGCRYFCIDVAHGFHRNVKDAVDYLNGLSVEPLTLMAGNVADLDAFNFLSDLGVKYIRVGVAGGSVCETRNKTGFGLPTLESVYRCSKTDRDSFIVADGGIRDSGDAVKCLAFGADFVMLGSILSGHEESPGSVVERDGKRFKTYRGMASESAQKDWRGWVSVAEGTSKLVEVKNVPLKVTVENFCKGIKSGFSYAGSRDLKEFQIKAKFEKGVVK